MGQGGGRGVLAGGDHFQGCFQLGDSLIIMHPAMSASGPAGSAGARLVEGNKGQARLGNGLRGHTKGKRTQEHRSQWKRVKNPGDSSVLWKQKSTTLLRA